MPGRVAIVTDSTAYLPTGLAEELGVTVVPLHVVMNGETGIEGVDVTPDDLARALSERRTSVTTSKPTPNDFTAAYRRALDDGAEGVVSVHLSSELSGTWDSARLASIECGQDIVRVVDSRSAAMGLGFAVLSAAEAAEAGRGLDDVEAIAERTVDRTTTLFYVDTLEHLRRGGRIGAARAWLGTALAVKPLLHVVGGQIVPLEKVRTAAKAIARLEQLALEAAGEFAVDIAVQHLAAAEKAAALADRLRSRVPRLHRLYASEVGAVVGAHVGPGLLGVVVVRR
ncbi:MAG: DegV family protein [Geodermatophilaceae bacterium]|jgi:DegV family protein with EDD domain|nr:DegV family protein [Geodermatophilaceae bacterium]